MCLDILVFLAAKGAGAEASQAIQDTHTLVQRHLGIRSELLAD